MPVRLSVKLLENLSVKMSLTDGSVPHNIIYYVCARGSALFPCALHHTHFPVTSRARGEGVGRERRAWRVRRRTIELCTLAARGSGSRPPRAVRRARIDFSGARTRTSRPPKRSAAHRVIPGFVPAVRRAAGTIPRVNRRRAKPHDTERSRVAFFLSPAVSYRFGESKLDENRRQ